MHEVGAGDPAAVRRPIGQFYASYFTYVNILGLLLQLFVVSRVVKFLGVPIGVHDPSGLSLDSLWGHRVSFRFSGRCLRRRSRRTRPTIRSTTPFGTCCSCPDTRTEVQRQTGDRLVLRPDGRRHVGRSSSLLERPFLRCILEALPLINAVMVLVWLSLAWRIGQQYKALTTSGQPP